MSLIDLQSHIGCVPRWDGSRLELLFSTISPVGAHGMYRLASQVGFLAVPIQETSIAKEGVRTGAITNYKLAV